jgi:transglutaminase-like putative cysteine protease
MVHLVFQSFSAGAESDIFQSFSSIPTADPAGRDNGALPARLKGPMHRLPICLFAALFSLALPARQAAAQDPAHWWPDTVETALKPSGDNRAELLKALTEVPAAQREGLQFLIENMPEVDLRSLKAAFLLDHVAMGYEALATAPWGASIPKDIFLNDILAYASLNEKRDGGRRRLRELSMPLIKDCKTPGEAAQTLNKKLFPLVNVRYSTTRKKPDQSALESMESGVATCSGLSILLVDACRAVGVPARVAGTPMWTNLRGNHTWLEIWDGQWHFTGACEPDEKGLDRGWFTGDAAKAVANIPKHAIYASSFKKTGLSFPLVWNRSLDWVSAINVTERYAAPPAVPAEKINLLIRVLEKAGGRRVAASVTVSDPADAAFRQEGTSRDESADLNNILPVPLAKEHTYLVRASLGSQSASMEVRTTTAAEQTVTLALSAATTAQADTSAKALTDLKTWLALARDARQVLGGTAFSAVPLTKADAGAARQALWLDYAKTIRETQADAMKSGEISQDGKVMKFDITDFPAKDGKVPAGGRSLFISMHGGGGAPAEVNTSQWRNQIKLGQKYLPAEGLYLAPRAPTDTWNLWHEGHIDAMFDRLITNLIVLQNVNPNRVFLMGYSAGGDGVYQLTPRMADRWAAASMMAGHPNEASPLGLRNVPFAIQVGANDGAYRRNAIAAGWGTKLDQLRAADPGGYEHFTDLPAGKGHWMEMEDRKAIPWMEKFTRQPLPDKVVWWQDDILHQRLYWLAVPAGKAAKDQEITATRAGQTITLSVKEVPEAIVQLNDAMLDLDQPVTIQSGGKTLFSGPLPRTIAKLHQTLSGRGDPDLIFSAAVTVKTAP